MIELESLDRLDLTEFVRPGDAIVVGQGTGEPLGVTGLLVAQRSSLSGARLFLGSGFSNTFQPEHADHLQFRGIGGIGTLRRLATAGVLEPMPCHFSSIEGLLADGTLACDVVLLLVSPPNAQGEYSFGLVNDYVRTAMSRARVVIAEISPHVPWTPCDRPLRREDITVAVHSDTQPVEVPTARFGDVERRLAAHLDDYIGDGATLQVGIGAIPEAILARLGDRRDLGIHSGAIGDSVVDLIEKGAVTNACKGIDPGVTITGVLFGTQRLFRFAHANPALRLCPSSYTHHIESLTKLRKLVSINAALQVDLTGQVNAEAIGSDYIGAVGGQVDFVRGAAATGGASIIALSATDRAGSSKIVASLAGSVTTARSDVDIVVTEHGAVRLRGMGIRERIRAMITIAAPEHRDALCQQAHETWGAA